MPGHGTPESAFLYAVLSCPPRWRHLRGHIVDYIRSHVDNMNQVEAAEAMDVPDRTLRRWLRQFPELRVGPRE
jgi:hypothetical protein